MSQTFYIRVIVDPKGAQQGAQVVRRELSDLEKAGDRLTHIMKGMFVARQVLDYAKVVTDLVDAYTRMENRVRTVAKSQADFDLIMRELPNVAKRSRGGLTEITDAYARISQATTTMGLSTGTVLRMTETLQKAMLAGGATTAEAASTMTQFTQALAKGKLDGDEFRSIMENSIPVQILLAKQLGVSTDKLKEMSSAGLITRDVMVNALVNGAADVDAQFAKTMPTIADQVTQFKNEMILLAGEFSKTADLSGIVGTFFAYLAAKIRETAQMVGLLVGGLKDLKNWADKATGGNTGTILGTGMDIVTGQFNPTSKYSPLGLMGRGLGNAAGMGANALGIGNEGSDPDGLARTENLLGALALADKAWWDQQAAIIAVRDAIGQVNTGLAKTYQQVAANDVSAGVKAIGNTLNAVLSGKPLDEVYAATGGNTTLSSIIDGLTKDAPKKKGGPKDNFPEQLRSLMGSIDSVYAAEQNLIKAEADLEKGRKRGLITADEMNRFLSLYRQQLEEALNPAKAFVDNIREEAFYTRLRASFNSESGYEAEVEYRKQIVELQKLGLDLSREEFDAADRQRQQAEKLASAARSRDDKKAEMLKSLGVVSRDDQYFRELAALTQRTGVSFDQKGQTSASGEQVDAYIEGIKDLQRREAAGEFAPKILSKSDEYWEKIRLLGEAAKENGWSNELWASAVTKLSEQYDMLALSAAAAGETVSTVNDGLRQGWDQIKRDLGDISGTVANEMVAAFDRMTEAIVTFATTGKFSWESFVMSLLEGAARIATQQLLLSLLKAFGVTGFGQAAGSAVGAVAGGGVAPIGAARGFEGTVSGKGGIDTNFMPFMLTNGEHVSITPAGEGRRGRGGAVVINNIYDSRGASIAMMQSPANERATINHIRKNPEMARQLR